MFVIDRDFCSVYGEEGDAAEGFEGGDREREESRRERHSVDVYTFERERAERVRERK